MITGSPWFDAAYYVARHPDAVDDPVGHFVREGERTGADPHPDFDTDAYVLLNPAARGQALTHFLRTVAAATSGPSALRPCDIVDIHHPVLSSGWFDAGWYRRRNDLGDGGWHPYVHYVRHGADAGLAPGPIFDGAEYSAHHAPEGIDPIAHWVHEQPDDGPFTTLYPLTLVGPRGTGRHRCRPRATIAGSDVCVMVHAFYPDVLPEIFARLRFLPAGWTLLLSVADEAGREAAHAAVRASFADGPVGAVASNVVIKVVVNRGRNFAPLLLDFRDEVLAHEVVLHLHTKKSLYSGGEATTWRSHLLDHLLASPAAVDAILSRFLDVPATGVVQPPTFPGLPHWANHWLANAGRGREILNRMGIDPSLGRGYVDYPVGGMFWARTAALRPLYDLGLTIDDFEPEAGQTDRTLAHTIERSVSWSAIAAGYEFVEFDVDTGVWRVGWTTRSSERIGLVGHDALAEAVADADLVTVDLFDTLLLRPSLDPDSLRGVAAERVGPDGSDLLDRRIRAEVQARGQGLGDSTITEIYDQAARTWPTDADGFARLRDEELALERRTIVARRWLIEALRAHRAPGRRIVLLTDTFLERVTIDDLIERIGATDVFDDVVVSNEVRARKDTGTVWDLVREREQPRLWVHIGDNEFSDVQQAADRGIRAVHIPSPASLASAGGFELGGVTADARPATAIVAGAGLASLAAARPDRDAAGRTPAEFGYGVLGPLTFAFVGWLVRRAAEDEVDRLLFVARDGYLPMRALERMRPLLASPVPRGTYFLTSRRAALRVALGGGDAESAVEAGLAAGWYGGTLAELFDARFGYRLDADELVRLEANRPVSLPDDREAVVAALRSMLPELTALGRRERDAFGRYVDALGLRHDGHVGLVDLGYSATAQRLLTGALPGRLTGYYAVLTKEGTATPSTHACFADDVVWEHGNLVYNQQRLFELVCAAPHGQVAGLSLVGERVRVDTDARAGVGPQERRVVAEVQDAAIRFCVDLLECHGQDLLTRPIDERAVSRALERALDVVHPALDSVFAGLHLDDHFSGIPDLPVTLER